MSVNNNNLNNCSKMCYDCQKNINQSDNMIECISCDIKFHRHCSRASTSTFRSHSYCENCIKNKDIIRYNPYFDSLKYSQEDCDKPYLQNQASRNSIDSLSPLSAILENCTNKSIEELQCLNSSLLKDENVQNTISCKFLNIDGNMKNFDTLLTTLKSIDHNFSIIALSETNIIPEVKDTYAIPNYESIYQNKKENKRKGSGLGIYIHSSLNYQTKEEL